MTDTKPPVKDLDRRDRWPTIVTPTRGAKAHREYRSNPLAFLLEHDKKLRAERARGGE